MIFYCFTSFSSIEVEELVILIVIWFSEVEWLFSSEKEGDSICNWTSSELGLFLLDECKSKFEFEFECECEFEYLGEFEFKCLCECECESVCECECECVCECEYECEFECECEYELEWLGCIWDWDWDCEDGLDDVLGKSSIWWRLSNGFIWGWE